MNVFFFVFFSPVKLSFQSQSNYFSRGYWATTILNHHEINFPWKSIIDSHHFNSTEQYQTFGLNFEILYLKREGSLTKWEKHNGYYDNKTKRFVFLQNLFTLTDKFLQGLFCLIDSSFQVCKKRSWTEIGTTIIILKLRPLQGMLFHLLNFCFTSLWVRLAFLLKSSNWVQ